MTGNHSFLLERVRPLRSFVLLEVLVALAILGIGLSAVLGNFTQGLKAIRREMVITTGVFLANHLIERFQCFPPDVIDDEGTFGEDAYPGYSWRMALESEEVIYDVEIDQSQQYYLQFIHIEVTYTDPIRDKSYPAAEVTTYLMDLERFSPSTKKEYPEMFLPLF